MINSSDAQTQDPRYRAIDWTQWRGARDATLLFVIKDDQVLLMEKKRGLGAGKVNAPGGRREPGESAQQAAVREVQEELLITPLGVRKAGEVLFQVIGGPSLRIFVYTAHDYTGEPHETDEAVPLWCALSAVPFERMWPSDRFWYPLLLNREAFEARTLYEGDELVGFEVLHT